MGKLLRGVGVCFGLVVVASMASVASGAEVKFHTHIDSYSQANNCRYAEWTTGEYSTFGRCLGSGNHGNAGSGAPFVGWVSVQWCNAGTSFGCDFSHGYTLPSGYTRWIQLCKLVGNQECYEYLVGAVKMPNGPVDVLGGEVYGKRVQPQNPALPVESRGGPLFLHVGFHGYISQGGGVMAFTGYVFGFRGYLNY